MQTNEDFDLDIDDLVRCYYAPVVRLCESILADGNVDEAEDAAQETFIAAARALNQYRGAASPKTWLFSIAINACRVRLRRRKARRALWETLTTMQRLFGDRIFGGSDLPERRVESSERDRELWAAVDALDEKHRTVVVLRYVHELSAGEIAQVLGITEGTVHSRLHYARQQLAGQLRRTLGFKELEAL